MERVREGMERVWKGHGRGMKRFGDLGNFGCLGRFLNFEAMFGGWGARDKGRGKRREIDSRLEGWRVEQRDKIERGGMV